MSRMGRGRSLMIKSRDELKNIFRSGAIPTASDFGCLIDSCAHVDEVAPLKSEIAAIEAKIGAVEQKVSMPAMRTIDADGTWQVLKADVDTLCAFEIVAQIGKSKASPFSAITHAVAVSAATRSKPTVKQTRSYSQGYWPLVLGVSIATLLIGIWLLSGIKLLIAMAVPHLVALAIIVASVIAFVLALICRDRRAITVSWRANGNWFDPHHTFDLAIRTGCNYGTKTQKVQMDCQIRRLWS